MTGAVEYTAAAYIAEDRNAFIVSMTVPPRDSSVAAQGNASQDEKQGAQSVAPASDIRQVRYGILVAGIAVAVIAILLRLLQLQVFHWGQAVPRAEGHTGPAARGVIVDRNGLLLASDRFYYQVAVTANLVRTPDDRHEIATTLEQLIGLPANRTLSLLETYKDEAFLELAKAVPLDKGERIEEAKDVLLEKDDGSPLQYVYTTPVPRRFYPQRQLASHLVGFVNGMRLPYYGVESYYDRFLSADSNVAFTDEPQSTIDSLDPSVRRFLPSLAGKDVILTIDSTIQWIITEELAAGMEAYKAKRGTVIVMEPESGEILGMVSLPSYDPNRFTESTYQEFLDPAVSEMYEPGSIYKVITMGAGLDTGVVTPTMIFNDTGSFSIGSRVIFNSQLIGYGNISAENALALSLNVVHAMIAEKIGAEKFYDYVRRFGFDEATEVDIAGEIPGIVKTPGDVDWSLSDLGTNSFGQGLAVTPLQMTNAVSAIANGGRLMRPHVVKARVYDGEVLETEPTVIHTVLSKKSADELAGMMVTAVEKGNPNARVKGFEVAGKSGTAQIAENGAYLPDQVNASFVGFAPAEDAKVVVFVRLERPDEAITLWASQNSAIIFSNVMRRVLEYLNVPPNDALEAWAGATPQEP